MPDILLRALVLAAAERVPPSGGMINILPGEQGELQPELQRGEKSYWVWGEEPETHGESIRVFIQTETKSDDGFGLGGGRSTEPPQ